MQFVCFIKKGKFYQCIVLFCMRTSLRNISPTRRHLAIVHRLREQHAYVEESLSLLRVTT